MNGKELIMCILAILFIIFILIPIYFFVEGCIRPFAVVFCIGKQTDCSKGRQLLTFIASILCLFFMFFIFGIWAIVQLILNLVPYCEGKKFQFTGDHIIGFLWPADHVLFKITIGLFSKIRGSQLSTQL